MLKSAKWLQRAVEFAEGLRRLPGDVKVEIEVAPPLSEEEVERRARSCHLPIPKPLQRLWTEASGHCQCKYWWDTPAEFHEQLGIAFPDWGLTHVWGGPEFLSARDICESHWTLDWANNFREEFPKDARYWRHSLPLIPVGNGDYAALYVRDDVDNPSVVYLDHDGYGGSGVLAPDFDTFFTLWERCQYIGIHFLCYLRNRKTGFIDPETFPVETMALQSLVRGACGTGWATGVGKPLRSPNASPTGSPTKPS